MANTQLYANAYVMFDTALFTETATVTVRRSAGAQPVMTIARGFAGISPGPLTADVDIEGAVPAAGFEFEPGKHMEASKQGALSVAVGGKVIVINGYFLEDSFSYGVGQEAKFSCKFHGSFAHWE